MKIIKLWDMKEGDVVDFTSPEPLYFDKKIPEKKVEKIVCPICGRLCRPTNDYLTYDHKLTFKGYSQRMSDIEMTDVCHYENEVEIHKHVEILRVGRNFGFSLDQVLAKHPEISKEAIYIVRMRKMYP